MNKPRILECTLRDGSYVINFQFTAADTRDLVRAMENIGFDMVEVGHGVGLGASDKGMGVAAETDETYLRAAAETVQHAQWGMFCIPGIAELYHVDMAAEYGMNFIRIGTNVEDYRQSQPFIERAKRNGMYVCSNFMKSYASEPEYFAHHVLETQKYGADLVYIVDSAGGMFPDDIERYVSAVRSKSQTVSLGFHGHNNLGMGVANSLKAVELGIEIIDTSLQGFGRGAGNTPTEQFLGALIRHGVDMNIDPIAVMDAGEKYIQPLIEARGLSSIDLVSGIAQFHSSYLGTIREFATRYRVDPRKLIIAVCQEDKVNAPEELVEAKARELSQSGAHGSWKPLYLHYYGDEQNRG